MTNLTATVPTLGTAASGGLSTKTNTLRFFSAKDGQVVESGLLADVHIVPNNRLNALVVAAPEQTMKLIEKLIENMDTVAAAASYVNVFFLKNADANNTANLIQQLFTGSRTATGGAGGAFGGAAAGGAAANQAGTRPLLTVTSPSDGATLVDLRLSVDDRTNAIIVAGSLSDMDTIRSLIARLEGSDTQARMFNVYKLKNAAAADVATSLQTFITNSLTVLTNAQFLTAYQQLQRNVVIVAEPVSNTILISATPQYYSEMMRLIEKIDAQPPQVLIQVLIAEVQLTNNEEFGVEVGLQSPVLFSRSIIPTGTVVTNADGTTVSTIGDPAFNFNSTRPLGNYNLAKQGTVGFQGLGNLGVGRSSSLGFGGFVFSAASDTFNLLVRALKAQGRIDIMSRPQLQVADNQTGFVQVGQNFPYLSATTLTGVGTSQQSIEYQQIGVTMRVTPRVSPDNKVLMRVEPQVASVSPTAINLGNGVLQPAFNIQTVQTTVLASDGETIVLGGLISKQDTRTENGIPFVKDIPYVGALFRFRSQQIQKREVIIIMTPHIIRNEADNARVLAEEAARMHWCVPDVEKYHGHGMDVIGPAMQGARAVPVSGGGGMIGPGGIQGGPGYGNVYGGPVYGGPGTELPPGAGFPGAMPGPVQPGFGVPPGTIIPGVPAPSGTIVPGTPVPPGGAPGVPPGGVMMSPGNLTPMMMPGVPTPNVPAMGTMPPVAWPPQPQPGLPNIPAVPVGVTPAGASAPYQPPMPMGPAGAYPGMPMPGAAPMPPGAGAAMPGLTRPPGRGYVMTPQAPSATTPTNPGPAKEAGDGNPPSKPADKAKEGRKWDVFGK